MSSLRELAVRAAQAVDTGALVELAQQLVRIPSYYPGPGEGPVVEFLQAYLARRGFRLTVQEAAPGRPNLIADLGEGPGGLILEGHTDVVVAGDEEAWTYPPFGGVVSDGRLYGRGAADMKAGLAAAIAAAEALRRVWGEPPRGLRLAILADEEGMMAGVKAFVREGHAQGFRGAIVCEPEENEICLWQKGALRVLVRFEGRMAHGAMPYAGANPIPPAARMVWLAREVEAELQKARPHPYLGHCYVTPTRLEASAGHGQLNVIPARAELAFDVRTVPGADHAAIRWDLQRALERALQEHQGVRAELHVIEDRPPIETPAAAAVAGAVRRAMELLGHPVRYGGVPGATDGTFLSAWAGLPVVTVGPGGRQIPHQVDEFVEVEQMLAAARVYAAAAVLLLGGDEEGAG